jgi:hypothetical protein
MVEQTRQVGEMIFDSTHRGGKFGCGTRKVVEFGSCQLQATKDLQEVLESGWALHERLEDLSADSVVHEPRADVILDFGEWRHT